MPPTSPPPLLLIPPSSHHRRPNIYTSTQSEGDLYYNNNAGGVVFVRGEEVGIVVLVLIGKSALRLSAVLVMMLVKNSPHIFFHNERIQKPY